MTSPQFHAPMAEKGILGAMLAYPVDVLPVVFSSLTVQDFWSEANQILFSALFSMDKEGIAISIPTVDQFLMDRKLAEKTGGITLLGDLAASFLSVEIVPTQIKTLKGMRTLRDLRGATEQIQRLLVDEGHDPEGCLNTADRLIREIRDQTTQVRVRYITQVADGALEQLEKAAKRGGGISGIQFGFPTLDELTGGLKSGEEIIIAARPGVGKSALALQILQSMAKERWDEAKQGYAKPGHKCAVISLEMTDESLYIRMLSRASGVDSRKLTQGKATFSELAAAQAGAETLADYPIWFIDATTLTMGQMRAEIRRLVRVHGVEVVFIDYLQLLSDDDENSENRNAEVTRISRGIKKLALELKISMVVMAQLSRKAAEGNAKPALHHLRESGSIEQDADMVLLLHRQEAQEGSVYVVNADLAKHRNGPMDEFSLRFSARVQGFDEIRGDAK